MSRYSSSIARHASRLKRGITVPNLTFEQRQEQRRLDAEADGHKFIPASRSPDQVRAELAKQATALHGSADAI